MTSFPILLFISFYGRQAKLIGAITFYDTVAHVVEKVFDRLPRALKRMSTYSFGVWCFLISTFLLAFFEGLVGVDGDIKAVSHKTKYLSHI